MLAIQFRDSRNLHPGARLCLALIALLFLLLPTPASANCMHLGVTPGELGDVDPGDGILRLASDREDLLVTAQWSSETLRQATFILSTQAGQEVMSWTVPRTPGATSEHRLTAALSVVANLGFQYQLSLASTDGTAPELTFRVAADCPPDGVCTYRLLPGLEGGVTLSHALWTALDEARATDSSDLLADVRAQHPELAAEIPGFNWQLQTTEPTPIADCRCRWLTIENLAPKKASIIGQQVMSPPLQDYGSNLEGAAFYGMLQGTEGAIAMTRNQLIGQSTLGLQLLCSRDQGESLARFPTSWPSLPELEVAQRQLQVCPAPCTPKIEYKSDVWSCAQAIAASRDGNRVQATAEVDAMLSFGSQALVAKAVTVNVDVAAGEVVRDTDFIAEVSSLTVEAEGAQATLLTGGSQTIDVEAIGGNRTSYALTSVSSKYRIRFDGSGSCEGIPLGHTEVNTLHDGTQEGGVTVEEWEDP